MAKSNKTWIIAIIAIAVVAVVGIIGYMGATGEMFQGSVQKAFNVTGSTTHDFGDSHPSNVGLCRAESVVKQNIDTKLANATDLTLYKFGISRCVLNEFNFKIEKSAGSQFNVSDFKLYVDEADKTDSFDIILDGDDLNISKKADTNISGGNVELKATCIGVVSGDSVKVSLDDQFNVLEQLQ